MILGIDIGGTTISLGLVSNGKIVKQITVPSFPNDATLEDTFDYLSKAINSIIVPEVKKIGIGVPSVVDSKKGIVYNAANIPSWTCACLAEELEKRLGLPVKINNDANCFALGAVTILGLEKEDIVLGVTIGTGIGSGLIINGQLINGRNTGVGEIGSLPFKEKTIEDYCAKTFFTQKGLNPKKLAIAAERGDTYALSTFDEFGAYMGELISMAVFAYDPSVIILGGGISNAYPLFENRMRNVMKQRIPYQATLTNLKIQTFSDPNAAIIGAAKL